MENEALEKERKANAAEEALRYEVFDLKKDKNNLEVLVEEL